MAYNVNGTYRKWAIQYQNTTNSTYLEKVSPSYFYTACLIWIVPSSLWALIYSFGLMKENFEELLDSVYSKQLPLLGRKRYSLQYSSACFCNISSVFIRITFLRSQNWLLLISKGMLEWLLMKSVKMTIEKRNLYVCHWSFIYFHFIILYPWSEICLSTHFIILFLQLLKANI